uniref:Phosphofructokinase domain-containing protein n=1 Tax=Leersia perrieri TaxID=77586 RepID=A0A0D9X777_9ORYZ
MGNVVLRPSGAARRRKSSGRRRSICSSPGTHEVVRNYIAKTCFVRVDVVFCGRQSPGGHNVIWGLHEAAHNPNSKLIDFLGPAIPH